MITLCMRRAYAHGHIASTSSLALQIINLVTSYGIQCLMRTASYMLNYQESKAYIRIPPVQCSTTHHLQCTWSIPVLVVNINIQCFNFANGDMPAVGPVRAMPLDYNA